MAFALRPLAALLMLLAVGAAAAQEPAPTKLRLSGMVPGGARTTVTEGWNVLEFTLTNFTDTDRLTRVFVLYEGEPEVQYGRQVWVPAGATVNSWLLAGPAASQRHEKSREIQMLLYDATSGTEELVLPRTDERVRARAVGYSKRETTTTILYDMPPLEEDLPPGQPPPPLTPGEEAAVMSRSFRLNRGLSERVQLLAPGGLPRLTAGFDAVDQVILASNEVADDAAGLRALRRWLLQGGTLWVALDLVDPDRLAPLLGEALDFQLVDRVGLTEFRVAPTMADPAAPPVPVQRHDRPVTLARVLLPAGEIAAHAVGGWPAWFHRRVGAGKVIFTTLGPRGWLRARRAGEPRAPFPTFPDQPVPTEPFGAVCEAVYVPGAVRHDLEASDLEPALAEQIGYTVVPLNAAALVFGVFLAAALGIGLLLRQTRRPETIGAAAPVLALAAGAAFVVLGGQARDAAPPTDAAAQLVATAPGIDEVALHGMLAAYRSTSGPAELAVTNGGFFEPDLRGLEGRRRRLVVTDFDRWHWEGVALPAGVRFAPFRAAAPANPPPSVVARFGPNGLEGTLEPGPFHGLTDAVLDPAEGRRLAVRLGPDRAFRVGPADVLPAGQYLAGAVLSDSQRRRQELYRHALKRDAGHTGTGPPIVYAWAEPLDLHFTFAPQGARQTGMSLLKLPLRLERPTPGTRITVPGPLVTVRRQLGENLTPPTPESSQPAEMDLRFQLPAAALPLEVTRARLSARVDARGRTLTVSGQGDAGRVELHRAESPIDPFTVEIGDARLLRPNATGGLHLHLSIGGAARQGKGARASAPTKWAIEYLELEVIGTAK